MKGGTAHRESHRALLATSFGVYLALLVWAVLWKLGVPHVGDGSMRHIKLVPFVATTAYGPSAPPEVFANLLLFVPFGAYLRLISPAMTWRGAAGVTAAASVALETSQFILAVGSADVTDVIMNTIGGVVGFALLAGLRHRLPDAAAAPVTAASSATGR